MAMMRVLMMFGLLAATMSGGCALLSRPSGEVRQVAVAEQTDQGAKVRAEVELVNRRSVPLPVYDVHYALRVGDREDRRQFRVSDEPALTMPPRGERTLVLNAALAGEQPAAGQAYDLRAVVRYQPPGRLRHALTRYGFPVPSLRVHDRGVLEPAGD